MICNISGTTPDEPVVSIKSGHVFEKRLIEKHLAANENKCPKTGQILNPEDLIPIQVPKTVAPRPTTATSIPNMLYLFQNEWDALMLETFNLKKQLESVKQELSHALYQHDAACRVIARLIKERDDARNALANFELKGAPKISKQDAPDSMQVEAESEKSEVVEEESQLGSEVIAKIEAKSSELSKGRKGRKLSETLATLEDIKEYTVVTSNTLHKPSTPGILCVDIHPSNQELILTGGVDGKIITFNRENKKIANTISAHSSEVTNVLFHPTSNLLFSTSTDHTAKVWKEGSDIYTVTAHKDSVIGCSLQPTGEFWATASADNSWAFHDLNTSSTLAKIETNSAFSSIQFHPDGLLLGTGTTDSLIKIWHLGTQKNVATFEGHKGKVVSLSFSENGYYLATAATDNVIKMWDLRKPVNFQSIELEGQISSLAFDYSGSYLAACVENDIRIYVGKTLNHAATLEKHSNIVTDVKWGNDALFLASTSMDRSLKTWGKKEQPSKKRKA